MSEVKQINFISTDWNIAVPIDKRAGYWVAGEPRPKAIRLKGYTSARIFFPKVDKSTLPKVQLATVFEKPRKLVGKDGVRYTLIEGKLVPEAVSGW